MKECKSRFENPQKQQKLGRGEITICYHKKYIVPKVLRKSNFRAYLCDIIQMNVTEKKK